MVVTGGREDQKNALNAAREGGAMERNTCRGCGEYECVCGRPTCSVCGKDVTNGMGQTDPLDPNVAVLVSFCDAHRPLPEESGA